MVIARPNCLATDRPDIQSAVEEASKYIAKSEEYHWSLLKRIGRHLTDAPRVTQKFRWQTSVTTAVGLSDSGWARDRSSRNSTSGWFCRMGPYVINCWSSTQQIIVLSSADVEFYAFLKCACQTLGAVNLALDFGMHLHATAHIDASAALAITQRQKVRQVASHSRPLTMDPRTGQARKS